MPPWGGGRSGGRGREIDSKTEARMLVDDTIPTFSMLFTEQAMQKKKKQGKLNR